MLPSPTPFTFNHLRTVVVDLTTYTADYRGGCRVVGTTSRADRTGIGRGKLGVGEGIDVGGCGGLRWDDGCPVRHAGRYRGCTFFFRPVSLLQGREVVVDLRPRRLPSSPAPPSNSPRLLRRRALLLRRLHLRGPRSRYSL